jgi:protein disulfide-isomerase
MAQNVGVQGVPFFVFDNKYAVSGAQHIETFVKTLEKVWEEGDFESKITVLNSANDDSCGRRVQLKGSKMSDVIKETTIGGG